MIPLVISGSSRTDGNTKTTIQHFLGEDAPIIDLCTLKLSPYDYMYRNHGDDFIPLVHQILSRDLIVFATPVYWYTMSAWMKIFWDRVTDLMYHHKDLARQLKGKTTLIFVDSCGGKPEGFESPLVQTFAYLGMHYQGCFDLIYPFDKHVGHNDKETERFLKQWPGILASCSRTSQEP